MENLTIFGSAFAFWVVAIISICLILFSDRQEEGGFGFCIIVLFIIVNTWCGNFNIFSIITVNNALTYLFIGFLFSLVRTYFKGKELSASKKVYFDLKDHIFRWWLLFPASAINWVFGTLLKQLFDFIYSKTGSLYRYIFNL